MSTLEHSFCVRPISVVVVPGTSVTITLPPLLNAEIGSVYTIGPIVIPSVTTGREEVIVVIDKPYAGIDNCGRYIVSQQLHNRHRECFLHGSIFRIQIVAMGAETAVAFRRGLAPRRAWLDVVTPPTP